MSATVKINRQELMDVASDVDVCSVLLLEQAVSDGIITGASGFNEHGHDPDRLHLHGEHEHFRVYAQRLAGKEVDN